MPPDVVPAASFPGPAVLGRGVVVAAGAATPPGFADAQRLTIDDEVVANPAHVAAVLHHRWLRRERVVIELAADAEALRAGETCADPPYAIGDAHTFHRERLQFLTWANTYDLRSGQPIWWHGVLGQRRAGAAASDRADLVLPDGRDAWVDGGPRGPLPAPLPEPAALVHRESVGLGRVTVQGDGLPDEVLANDQHAAVTHRAGPARIIAPAGSGKTRVLTARLRHLLRDRAVEPQLVTAVAYNTRAAAQMRARTDDLGASIRTLHSLALWIVTRHERRQVITERDQRTILDRLLTVGRAPNQDPFAPYLEALAEVRLGLRDPVEVELERSDVDGFTELFDRYREVLADRGVLDFDEQIYRAIELLLTDADLRRDVQRVGTHLLVDEFQDLTPAFLLLVRLVAGPAMQVFAVGDDDQTIYSYAGATPDFLVRFDRWFPGADHHALTVNYRCPTTVVDSAVNLLSHNRARVPKTITSLPRDDDALRILRVPSTAMADHAVAMLRHHLDVGVDPAELAVLARVNSALLPVQVALSDAGLAHTAPLDATVLGRTGIRAALGYLRLGLDPDRLRRDDVLDTINRPARKVRSAVAPLLRRRSTWSLEQLRQLSASLDPTHRDRFDDYLDDLDHLAEAIDGGADTARCLWIIRSRIGLDEAVDVLDRSRTRPEGSSHGDDLDALAQLASLHPVAASFQTWLTQALGAPSDPAGITLSTIHRVKGMEWPHVLVFAANQGLFPHRLADDLEEERRVFHVAITRCVRSVTVVADEQRTSAFVDELGTAAADPVTTDAQTVPLTPAQRAASRTADARVLAEVGVTVTVTGGLTGTIVEVDRNGATVAVPDGPGSPPHRAILLRVGFHEPVVVDGEVTRLTGTRRTVLASSPSGDGDPAAADPALFERLRTWRARTAATAGVPAFLVFHDSHLQTIAERKPRTVRELAACPGVGPAKLDRYADDLLDLIEDHLVASETGSG